MLFCVTLYVTGLSHLGDCPKLPNIPVYMLVGGCVGIIKVLATIWRNITHRRLENTEALYDSYDTNSALAFRTYRVMDAILSVFLLGWQITGTYWVFSIWEPNYEQLLHEPSNWCDRTVYLFSAYQILGCYAFMGLVLLTVCCLSLCYLCSHVRRCLFGK
jgi:hypothetical protein